MSTHDVDPDSRPAENTVRPGALLRQARQQKGMSLSELAAATRLSGATLTALETDDFRGLGQPVYARGYYRKCAEVLGLNVAALVNAYEAASGTDSPVPRIMQRPSIKYREGAGRTIYLGVSLVLLAVGTAGWWALQPPGLEWASLWEARAPALKAPSPAPAPGVAPADRVEPAPTRAQPDPGETMESVLPPGTLRVVFVEDSWLEVSDASGQQLAYSLFRAGQEREMFGELPYTVYLGYAPGVRLFLDDRPLRIREQVQADDTAQFKVGIAK